MRAKHLRGSAKKVIIPAPAKSQDLTLVLGVRWRLRSVQASSDLKRVV
jgi:hypothetical protein